MMEDQELQELVEKGLSGNSPETELYRQVFEGLNRDEGVEVAGFSSYRIVSLVEGKKERSEKWLIVLSGLMMICCLAITIAYLGVNFELGFLKRYGYLPGFTIIIIGLTIVFRFIEKRVSTFQKSGGAVNH